MKLFRDSGEDGQALIVVAICMAVLVAGLAFAVDWGYATVERRAMQNLADASATAAGKRLATSVMKVNGAIMFSVTQEQTWCTANDYANPSSLKTSFAPSGTINQLQIFYGDSSDPTAWTTSTTTCTGDTEVPPDTRYVRALVTVTFRSLVAATVGHSTSVASASARVRLSGLQQHLHIEPMRSDRPQSGPAEALLGLERHRRRVRKLQGTDRLLSLFAELQQPALNVDTAAHHAGRFVGPPTELIRARSERRVHGLGTGCARQPSVGLVGRGRREQRQAVQHPQLGLLRVPRRPFIGQQMEHELARRAGSAVDAYFAFYVQSKT